MKDARTVQLPQLRGPTTSYGFVQAVVPNRWQGEANCLVGPFSSRSVAEYFANAVVDFGHYETVSRRVFPKGDAWFVEVREVHAGPSLASASLS